MSPKRSPLNGPQLKYHGNVSAVLDTFPVSCTVCLCTRFLWASLVQLKSLFSSLPLGRIHSGGKVQNGLNWDQGMIRASEARARCLLLHVHIWNPHLWQIEQILMKRPFFFVQEVGAEIICHVDNRNRWTVCFSQWVYCRDNLTAKCFFKV